MGIADHWVGWRCQTREGALVGWDMSVALPPHALLGAHRASLTPFAEKTLHPLDLPIDRDTVVHMETVTISPKFQIVIPQRIREAMGLRSGEKARMLSFRNRIEVIPVRDIRSLRGYLKGMDTSFVRDGDRV